MTVRSTCRDVSTSATNLCSETGASTNASARAAYLNANCACDVEQHYQYRWDAVNRLAEARRYDRGVTRGGNSGSWQLQTRQQYEYDESNNRLLKRVVDGFSGSANGLDGQERMALYVAPGAFERRGLVTGASSYDVEAPRRAETQYLVATPGGTARLIWAETNGAPGNGAFAVFNREARLAMNVTDLLQSTSAVIDLFDGDVLERGTYLPSGVRETRTLDEAQEAFPLEPLGFTGKEDDLEVGLMYFGHRYLMPHLGRWASPDPLQIHSGGGGEFGNSYHYVGGNLLQARDPDGLGPPGLLRNQANHQDRQRAVENQVDGYYLSAPGHFLSWLHPVANVKRYFLSVGYYRSWAMLERYTEGSGELWRLSPTETYGVLTNGHGMQAVHIHLRAVVLYMYGTEDSRSTLLEDPELGLSSELPSEPSQLVEGTSLRFSSSEMWSRAATGDDANSVGGYRFRVHTEAVYREATEDRPAGFDMFFRVLLTDRYDFHAHASAVDAVAARMAEVGEAAEFDVEGSTTELHYFVRLPDAAEELQDSVPDAQ